MKKEAEHTIYMFRIDTNPPEKKTREKYVSLDNRIEKNMKICEETETIRPCL